MPSRVFVAHRLLVAGSFALVAGCGVSQSTFQSDYAAKYCALQFQCEDTAALSALGWTDEAACVSDLSAVDTASTSYDKKAAKDCLTALDAVTCDDLASNTFPAICLQVQ